MELIGPPPAVGSRNNNIVSVPAGSTTGAKGKAELLHWLAIVIRQGMRDLVPKYESLDLRMVIMEAGIDTRPLHLVLQLFDAIEMVRRSGDCAVHRHGSVWRSEISL
jgi:hypothetical protein